MIPVNIDLPTLLAAGLVLLLIFWLGLLSLKIKVPNVILYILLGIILTDAVYENEILHFASEIGIVLLFFLLGLDFNVKRLRGIAIKIWPAGTLDLLLSLGVVMAISYSFGLDLFTSFILGGVTYATSSSITAKLLDDTSRMANTETEFILALLIFEDLVAPIVIAIIMGMSSGGDFQPADLLILVGKIIGLSVVAIILSEKLFKRMEEFLGKIDDEDFKVSLFIGVALAYGGIALLLGLSEVLGAFLAGIMLSEIGRVERERVEQTVLPVKDLMLPLFFVYFGTTIKFGNGIPMAGLLLSLLVWSLAAKIIVGIVGGKWYGLSRRVSFRAGLSLCARGEFSVVIASLATGVFKIFSGIYIVIIAFIGMLLFEHAPKITNKIYGKPVRKKKDVKVPGS